MSRKAAQTLDIAFEFAIVVLDEQLRQGRDILGSVTERRNGYLDDVETEVKILAEHFLLHRFSKVLVGRGHNPEVELDVSQPAQAAEGLLLQDAQELGLETQRNLPYLVQEERAPVRQFEDTAFLGARVREGAFLVAEQLAFQQCGGDGRAVDSDEWSGLPKALVVKCLGDQILAGPALAVEQHRAGFARAYAPYQFEDLQHDWRFGNHRVPVGR